MAYDSFSPAKIIQKWPMIPFHRPNDIITVKYSDGKIVADTKYKKVKDDIEAGKCVVV